MRSTALALINVPSTCESVDCSNDSSVVMIVTGEYGEDGLAAYCDDHADDHAESDNHTAVSSVWSSRGGE